jgi:hypothetical protein
MRVKASSKKVRTRTLAARVRGKKAPAKRPRQVRLRPPPAKFQPPVLHGGTEWIGGDLSRADLYGNDGR